MVLAIVVINKSLISIRLLNKLYNIKLYNYINYIILIYFKCFIFYKIH